MFENICDSLSLFSDSMAGFRNDTADFWVIPDRGQKSKQWAPWIFLNPAAEPLRGELDFTYNFFPDMKHVGKSAFCEH